MPSFDSEHLRNIVLLSHGGAGKTMISEAMLHASGVTSRLGSTDDGTTTSDYEPEEQRRGTSIQTSVLPCPWKGHKINVLDTPGYADYRGEAISGLRVADSAVVVVAAPSGVEVGTLQMWQMAEEAKLPRIVFVSKLDRENADFQRALDSITERFGRRCVAVQVPVGKEASFSGVVDLLDQSADVPDELSDEVEAARERLTEAIAETDDELATKYLEGEQISQDELTDVLKKGVASGTIVPVMTGAAASGIGASELMDGLVNLMPSPAERGPASATDPSNESEVSLPCDDSGPLAALVFKTSADPFVGKLSYFRVYSGKFAGDSQLWNADKRESERVGQVFVVRGKTQEPVAELAPGDIGAVAKLSSVGTGNTLSRKDNPLILPGLEFPAPVYQMAVFPKSKADLDKITSALARITEEDPSLNITREPNTLEMLLGGLGDAHVGVTVERIKRKFGVDILLATPKVPYMETIVGASKVQYRHKKQTGGHGQFADVWLEVEPLPRGKGFEFAQRIVGGSVPREYIPAVEKGAQKAMADGVVAGFPVIDVRASLVDGSFHPVDSSGISFEIAGGHALSKGIKEASPVLLEPILTATIMVPDSDTGDVAGDINGRRGRILGMTPEGDGRTVIEAEVPQAEMLRYATELRSQTQGRGEYSIEFNRYEEVPAHLVQRIVDAKEEAQATA